MAGDPIRDGVVVVDGDRVAAVGPRAGLLPAHPGARVRDWPGVLLPGLVNAHAHLQYTGFADLARAELPFISWIQRLTARAKTWTAEQWQTSARQGTHALLSTGTTCVADVVTHAPALGPVARSGLAGTSYLEVVGVDDTRWPDAAKKLLAELSAAPAGRPIGVAPHALYTLGSAVVQDLVEFSRERGLRVHAHCAETLDECDYVAKGAGPIADAMRAGGYGFELLTEAAGRSPVAEFGALGALGPDVHLAHGIHVDAADRELLRSHQTAVALCCRSNALLGAGAPPVAAYLDEDSPLAVGTDSAASSPDLDLLAELRALGDLARSQGYDSPDLAERLVRLATVDGAAALGLASESGVVAPGVRADLAVFDVPTDGSPYAALVDHGAGSCVATVLAGKLVHRRGT